MNAPALALVRPGGGPGIIDEGDHPLLGVRPDRRLAAYPTTPPAVHPLDAVWGPDRLRARPAIPALECREWLGVGPVLGGLFPKS